MIVSTKSHRSPCIFSKKYRNKKYTKIAPIISGIKINEKKNTINIEYQKTNNRLINLIVLLNIFLIN
jgi:hypothetical protein